MSNRLKKILQQYSVPLKPIPIKTKKKTTSKPIKAILFDIYGTLLISAAGDIGKDSELKDSFFYKAVKKVQLNLPPLKFSPTQKLMELIKEEHLQKKAQGIVYPEIDITNIWKTFFKLLSINLTPPQILEFSLHYELLSNPVWPMPHLQETLAYLKEKRVILGIISNAQFYTPLTLEFFLNKSLDQYFTPELCIWSYQEGEAKPSKKLFLKAKKSLKKLNLEPDTTLYVGNDVYKDLTTSREIGFKGCLLATDKRSYRYNIKTVGFDIITSLKDLKDYV